MSIKKTLLAFTAMAAFAFAVLPSVASAGFHVELPEKPEFTVTGGATELTSEAASVPCESVTGNGKFEDKTTGSVMFLFHGCELLGTECHSESQPEGTITTTTLKFHIGTLKIGSDPSEPVIVITPGAPTNGKPHFATFICLFGLVEISVSGNGVVGEITSPPGTPSNSLEFNFETEGGTQVLNEASLGGGPTETFELEASVNGGEYEPAGQDGEGKGSFIEGQEGTLVETKT